MSAAGPPQGARPPEGGSRAATAGGDISAGPPQGARPPEGGSRAATTGGDFPSAAGPPQGARPPEGEIAQRRGPRAIYLASRSPRRKELLRQIGIEFDELIPDGAGEIVECARASETGPDYVTRIARTKAAVGWHEMTRRALPARPVLAADTEVIVDGEVLGKPVDAAHATRMLGRLSGTAHDVVTVVAVRWNAQMHVVVSSSRVTLRMLGAEEIARYVASGEPFDKAGGYGIQGRAAEFVAHLSGSYSGVMGLPLYETAGLLRGIGYHSD